jgi:ATP-dependent Clp protease adaptor protein ClpS
MSEEEKFKIVIYNDDVNNFQYIIACLMRYCNHSKEQAEQCALIAHNNKKCDIMNGSYSQMSEVLEDLISLDIKVKIDTYESNLRR